MGFLHRDSLNLIVAAPRDSSIADSLYFPQQFVPSLSMPLNVSGQLTKFVIAAKFNHSAHSGWPILQIRRTVGNDSNVTTMTTVEPTPTGYLNVFEYNLSFNIHLGDQVRILNLQPSTTGSRYSLAYLGNPPKPLVHIE